MEDFVNYIIRIIASIVLITIVALPFTFIANLLGYCIVPAQAHDIQCVDSFLGNAIGLGFAAGFLTMIAPVVRLLNKPIKL